MATLWSCNSETQCPACMTPPAPFYFEIVDKETNQNIFTLELAKPQDLKLINTIDNKELGFAFLDENDINIIMINSIGWQTEVVNAELWLKNEKILTLKVDATAKSDECCSWTEYNSVEIEHQDFSLERETGAYKIFI